MRHRLSMRLSLAAITVVAGGCAHYRQHPSTPMGDAQAPSDGFIGNTLDVFEFRPVNGKRLAWDPADGILESDAGKRRPEAILVHAFQPDCNSCQSQARALDRLHRDHENGNVAVVGITHRGDRDDAAEFVKRHDVHYPVAVGTGGEWTAKWGRGDPMYIMDARGTVVYSQVGFEESDPAAWYMVLEDLAAGRAVSFQHPQRAGERLSVGDPLPVIELPDLMTGRSISLKHGGEELIYTRADGQERRYRASIGFFSRY